MSVELHVIMGLAKHDTGGHEVVFPLPPAVVLALSSRLVSPWLRELVLALTNLPKSMRDFHSSFLSDG